jgi:hypothetical protein
MTKLEMEELTAQVAQALGVAGAFRLVGDERIFVLDRAGTLVWGEPFFDPVRNSEHSFLLAGVFELTLSYGAVHATARPNAIAGPASSQMYAHHPDRFAAARVAVARCVVALELLKRQAAAELPYRDKWA